MPEKKPHQLGEQTTPEQHGHSTTPSVSPQAVMELQKSAGELTGAVNSLKESIDRQEGKIETIEGQLSGLSHKMYAAIVVAGIFVALGGFLFNKAWDLMASNVSISQQKSTNNTIKPQD